MLLFLLGFIVIIGVNTTGIIVVIVGIVIIVFITVITVAAVRIVLLLFLLLTVLLFLLLLLLLLFFGNIPVCFLVILVPISYKGLHITWELCNIYKYMEIVTGLLAVPIQDSTGIFCQLNLVQSLHHWFRVWRALGLGFRV